MKVPTAALAFATAVSATFFSVQAPAPPMPVWIAAYCADASPCTPVQVVNGIAFAQVGMELDGSPCPDPIAGGDVWSGCTGQPSGAHWLLLTRGDVQQGPGAIDHDVIFASTLPLYGPGGPPGADIDLRGLPWHMGVVVGFGLPPGAVATPPQQGVVSVLTEAEVDARIAAAIAAIPGGGLTPAQFQTMLDASTYGAFVDPVTGHTHNRPDLTITRAQSLDGVTITLPPTGPPQ